MKKASPKVAFFPSSPGTGASHLRAVLVAKHLRSMGWNSISIPAQLELMQRERILKKMQPDMIVFQKCRHPFNSHEHAFGFPYILDIDDADFHDERLQARLEDTAAHASGVVAGSRYIKSWADQFNDNCQVVWTGTPISKGARPSHAVRGRDNPVITWAQASPLDYKAELDFVAHVLRAVAAETSRFAVRFYGVNSDDARQKLVRTLSLGSIKIDTVASLPYQNFLTSLRSASIGLSPIIADEPFSRGKSFGKVLGYLDAKVPVVCSDEADHALFFRPGSGYVTNNPDDWKLAILELLQSHDLRESVANNAFLDFQQRLSIEASSKLVGNFIEAVI